MTSQTTRTGVISPESVLAVQDDLEAGRNNGAIRDYFQQSSHPVASFFFLAFRTGALLTYLLGSFFSNNFTLIFVLVILLLAFDFWTTKNVSGRLLVGLRWWNEIQHDGSNKWVFESANPNRKSNSADSQLFWVVLYGTPLIWGIFAFSCILTMKVSWLFIVVIAIAMNAANVYGFSQCDKDAKRRWTTNLVTQSALGSLGSGATGLMSKAVSSSIARSLFSSRR
ncbi:Golgi apparatus membrane protein tvp23 [Mucor circinelloides]